VFGSRLKNGSKIVIRDGKRLPFFVEETAAFDISQGENATAEEVEGSTIPKSWVESSRDLEIAQTKPVTAMVLGAVDSGKTSFCTYLINMLLRGGRKVAILDGDLGQSDVGPPCSVGYTFVTRPTTDLFNLQEKNAFFVGATSPNGFTDRVIEGMTALRKEILDNRPDVVIVNTDGWVEGDDAVNYKVQVVQELNPDVILCIQQKDELEPILNALENHRKVLVEFPSTIRQRSQEKRRNLRELGYIKYLRNARVQSLPLNWLKIEGDELFGLSRLHENFRQATKIYELLGMKPLHFAELQDRICIVIGRTRWINSENIKKVEEFAKKRVVLTHKGEEEGVFTALYNVKKKFLGVGVVQEIDFTRKILKISTPVSDEISVVAMGKVKLDKNLKEIPGFEERNQMDFASSMKLF
jgi:polynucleotide 5'-hydroxyl-kinase GRC3/NOL9